MREIERRQRIMLMLIKEKNRRKKIIKKMDIGLKSCLESWKK